MHIRHVEIGNFRKLHAVRVDFSEQTTVFVGANNSGKTSAMVALRRFLVERAAFSINDLTLVHWAALDTLGSAWEKADPAADDFDWGAVMPHLDVWLSVPKCDLHYVQKLLPSLDWDGEDIGVRLRWEPKDRDALRHEYVNERKAADEVMNVQGTAMDAVENAALPADAEAALVTAVAADSFALWPKSMMDFLSRRMRGTFEVRAYLLDPAKLAAPTQGIAAPQALPPESEPIDGDPFKGLIRIDEISAQRGFGFSPPSVRTDAPDDEADSRGGKRLSSQLRNYYTQHLDPFDKPEPKDLEALQAMHAAQTAFGKRLESRFADALKELEDIGYPGVTDPKLKIASNIKPIDGLNHASAVQYEVPTHSGGGFAHRLPEDSNGLGYQNLVSMVFALMSFRDKWMKVGKASKTLDPDDIVIPPLHLVLIEEPEAHLHAQVQQVFIKQAYDVLRKHDKLKGSTDLRTQLVVSTHSSHLAHEASFASLRYFRRLPAKAEAGAVPLASVVNLSEIFGSGKDTERFARRYLKATHCDLFFADGAILVEGPAERILVPHLVRKRSAYEFLRRCYITWLEIGGSHAHRLRSLIEHLGLNTLIITDIDAKDAGGNAVPPVRGAGLKARNETLRTWIPKEESLDTLLDKKPEELFVGDAGSYAVRVAYQQPIIATFKTKTAEALANTFEDALVFENIAIFEAMDGTGLVGRFRKAVAEATDHADLAARASIALARGGKAEFAMDLLDSDEIDKIKVPAYIDGGLLWLVDQLKRKEDEILGKAAGMSAAPPVEAAAGALAAAAAAAEAAA